MDQVADLREDYEWLGLLLQKAEGSGAAAIARERRIIREKLEALEATEEVSKVDELASRRSARTGDSGSTSGRRKSG